MVNLQSVRRLPYIHSVKLSELVQQKEETQAALDEKMERWVYLSDLAEKIESQKNGQPV